MSEVVKRQRDQSSTPEPEAKRANVEAANLKTETEKEAETPSSPPAPSSETMASDAPTKPVNEEQDAVDLGSGVTADATASSDNKGDSSSVSNGAGQDGDQAAGSAGSVGDSSETQATQISMRTLIVTSDASIIIGKSGKHINEIRDKSNARLNIVSCGTAISFRNTRQKTSSADNNLTLLSLSSLCCIERNHPRQP